MTDVTAELFCDPYAVACWRHRPTLRHVEYKFPEVDWLVRPVVALPEPLDGDAAGEYAASADDYATAAERAAEATGLPLADGAFADGAPTSWAACEALVAVRERDPAGALALFHRLSTRAFANGRPTDSPADLADAAAEVAAVDRETVLNAVGSRRATATVGADLEVGRRLVDALPETAVRGDPETLPLAPRAFDDDRPEFGTGDSTDGADDASGESTDADSDAGESDGSGSGSRIPAPGVVRLRTEGYTVVVDPAKGLQEFADVLRTFDPDMGEANYSSELHGRDVIRAYTIPQGKAERMISEDYEPTVRKALRRLDRAFLPEIARCTDLDPETVTRTLGELQTDGAVRRARDGAWHLVREETD